MRISTISSSTVSVVTRVINSVTVAGIDARGFFHLGMKREHGASKAMGYWLERYSEHTASRCPSSTSSLSNLLNRWRPLGIARLAICPAPARPVYAQSRQQG